MTENNGKLYAKIAKVAAALAGKLSADKRNEQQRYDYISADMVLQEAGKAASAEGLVIVPIVTAEAVESIEYTDNYGKQKSRYDAVVEFDMVIADDTGASMTAHWVGRGSDYAVPDKATYKAITSGHKYFLMKLFFIGVGNEDGEHDSPKADSAPRPAQSKKVTRQSSRPQERPDTVGFDDLPSAGDDSRIADIIADFGDMKTVKLGMVCDRMAGVAGYKTAHHVLAAVKKFDFPDGVIAEFKQVISGNGAIKLVNWLVERHEEVPDAVLENDTSHPGHPIHFGDN